MSVHPALPAIITTPTDVAALLRAADVRETPCGEGTIVWHLWGSGKPLLLLHGGSGSWTHWLRNIGALVGAGYQVIAPDLPGFGDSASVPDGGDADTMPVWLEKGLSQLVGTSAVQIAGFSFGGMVGTLLAAAFPERAAGLVLSGAPALEPVSSSVLDLRTWKHLPPGPARDEIHRHNLSALMLADTRAIDEFAVRLHAANLERDRLPRRRLAWSDIVVRTLPRVQCPVHGIWGGKDAVYVGREHVIGPALAQAADFRGLQVIPDAGHWVQYERADQFNDMLIRALAERQTLRTQTDGQA